MEQIKTFYGQNKNMVLGIAGIVAVILVVVGGHAIFSGTGEQAQTENQAMTADVASPAVTVKSSNTAPKMSYADALTKYKNYTIQFGDKCDVIVFKHVYKNNTDIMIDNRGSAKMFRVGENPVSIAAYDFAIVKLYSATIPKTIGVDCGTRQNVSEITIEK